MIVSSINKLKQLNRNHFNKLITTLSNNLNNNSIINKRFLSTINQNSNNSNNNNNNNNNNNSNNNNNNSSNNNNFKLGLYDSFVDTIEASYSRQPDVYKCRSYLSYPNGTESTIAIEDNDDPTDGNGGSIHIKSMNDASEMSQESPELLVARSILSNMEFFTYVPFRNTPLINPYIKCFKNQTNYLFEKNPLFVVMGTPAINILHKSEKYHPSYKTTPPSWFKETEFLKDSEEAIRRIFKFAENESSYDLQDISCLPITPALLLIRDIYYTVRHTSNLGFSVGDLSIDNFEIKGFSSKVYCTDAIDGDQNYLKVESNYLITHNKLPSIVLEANWLTKNIEDSIDWRIFGLSLISNYQPK